MWMIVEIMGHTRHAGLVSEEMWCGSPVLRIEQPGWETTRQDREWGTQRWRTVTDRYPARTIRVGTSSLYRSVEVTETEVMHALPNTTWDPAWSRERTYSEWSETPLLSGPGADDIEDADVVGVRYDSDDDDDDSEEEGDDGIPFDGADVDPYLVNCGVRILGVLGTVTGGLSVGDIAIRCGWAGYTDMLDDATITAGLQRLCKRGDVIELESDPPKFKLADRMRVAELNLQSGVLDGAGS